MEIVALCVSKPKTIVDHGREISTGIYKSSVDGPRMVRRTNIDGDGQADLTVHGGPHKAVYAFPAEHYHFYQESLGQTGFEYGHFGENLTLTGLLETDVYIGDRYQMGQALLEVSQPRSPCFKFGIKMGSREAIKTCLTSAKTGFYLRVVEEGNVKAGDKVELMFRDRNALNVEAVHRLYYFDKQNIAGLKQAASCAALAPSFKDEFVERLGILGIEFS
jgi:MOSC domain-containing protein YiiM